MQRQALAVLFAVLALGLAAAALAAFAGRGGGAARWIVGPAALVLGLWLASLATSLFRRS